MHYRRQREQLRGKQALEVGMQSTGIKTTSSSASTSSTVAPQGGAWGERQKGVDDQHNEKIPRNKSTWQISRCNLEGATEKARSSAVTASITLQCNFRMHLAAKMMLGAITREYSMKIVLLQAAVRGCLRHIDWLRRGRRKDHVTEAASMPAARAALKYSEERQTVASRVEENMHPLSYAIQLKRKRASLKLERTTVIQSKFRRALANHRWKRVLREVGHICAQIRANQECRHVSKRNAAISLQAYVRARLQASQGAKVIEQGLCDQLSCVLQACCRRYGPRKIHRDTIASVSLQAATRRRRTVQTFCARKAVLGESSYAWAAQSRPRRKYAQTVAGLLMAAYLRARVVRKKWQTVDGAALRKTPSERDALDKERKEAHQMAVEYIQASIRGFMQRKVGDEQMQYARETDSCCLLRTACRMLACKKEMEETASKRLSHFDKALIARRRHARWRGASVQLQASLRRSLEQSSGTSHISREQFSCQRLQATCRRSVAREVHRTSLAARTIHTAMLRRTAGQGSRQGKEACATLKRFFKAATSRRKYAETQIAVRLQAASRRRRAFKDRKRQEYSASCIGRIFKTALAFIRHAEQRASAMKLKAALRRMLGQLYGQSVMEDSNRESAAGHLDSVCRRMLARDAYFKDVAARTMQAAIRLRHAQTFSCSSLEQYIKAKLNRQQYEDKRSASGCLQSAFRRHKGQANGLSQMEKIRQASSAQSLEAACRRTLAHETHRRLLAVQILKKAVRQRHDLLRGQEHREAHAALEHIFRAALARQIYSVKQCTAVTLQTVLRRKKGHTEGQSHMDVSRRERAAQTLQAQCRRLLATQNQGARSVAVRSGNEEQRTAATKLQAVIRAHSGRHEGQGQMEAFATESLQAVCRRALAREMHMKGLMASTMQATARCVLHVKADEERGTQEEELQRAEEDMHAKKEEDTRLEGELQENLQKFEKEVEEKKRAEEKTKEESQRKERERQGQEVEKQRQQEKEKRQAEKLAQQQEERMLREEEEWATAERALQEKEAGSDKRESEVNPKVIPTLSFTYINAQEWTLIAVNPHQWVTLIGIWGMKCPNLIQTHTHSHGQTAASDLSNKISNETSVRVSNTVMKRRKRESSGARKR